MDYKAIIEVSAETVFQALVDTKMEFRGIELDVADVSIDGLIYMIEYGFAKSLQDCVSGHDKALRTILSGTGEEAIKARNELAAEGGVAVTAPDDAIVKAVLTARMTKRTNAIREGSVGGGRTGPRKVGLERVMWDVAFDRLKAIATKAKKSLPTKAADLNPMVDAYLKANESTIREEATRRMADIESGAEDAAAILAGLGL